MTRRTLYIAFLIAIGGIIAAFVLFLIIQITNFTDKNQFAPLIEDDVSSAGDGKPDNQSPRGAAALLGITPVSFDNITEFTTDKGRKIRLSGSAQPQAILTLQNRGARLRQIKSDDNGNWGVTLDVDRQAMAIEAVLFMDDPAIEMRSDDVIFRIPVPNYAPSLDRDTRPPALLIKCSPGQATKIIQSPFQGSNTGKGFKLLALDYDGSGGVIFSGQAPNSGRVRLYLGDSAIGETGVQSDGFWQFTAAQILPLGSYDIWAELIRPDVERLRIGTGFERLPPLSQSSSDEGALSVHFGPVFWQIRRSLIGGGTQSTAIFAATP